MKNRRQLNLRMIALGLCIISLGIFAVGNQAEADAVLWKFTIPIELKSIPPDMKYFNIYVLVLDGNSKGIASTEGKWPLGPDGSFAFGGVSLDFHAKDMFPGHYPGEAVSYKAKLSFATTSGEGPLYEPDSWEAVKHQPGTDFVPQINGSMK